METLIEMWAEALSQGGISPEALDDLVHDLADSKASGINNDGREAQRAYLGDDIASSTARGRFDETVFALASTEASEANNGGLREQIRFIIQEVGLAAAPMTILGALGEDGEGIVLAEDAS